MSTTQPVGTDDRESAHHPALIVHLVMGVAFLGLVAVWALIVGDVVEGDDVRFLLPIPWVLAGATGLVALLTSDRRRRARRSLGWIADPPPADGEPPSTMER